MGGYCYPNCIGQNQEEMYSSETKCQCRYLYYTKTEKTLLKYYCLDQNQYCHKSYNLEKNM